ncbi:MAG TPA: hypothetical protein VH092_12970, partial [Urbifossiella sp.]|nr:hypothetical protein [Urbifossiella sp.]
MYRAHTVFAALLALAGSAAAAPPPVFRPFNGVTPEQFRASAIARWADQVVFDLGTLKTESNAPGVAPPARSAIATTADRAAREALGLAQAARQPKLDRGRLDAGRAALDRAV